MATFTDLPQVRSFGKSKLLVLIRPGLLQDAFLSSNQTDGEDKPIAINKRFQILQSDCLILHYF